MAGLVEALNRFVDSSPDLAMIRVVETKGSAPREQGAWMLVSPTDSYGTVGGGQLEFLAIARAREMLADIASGTVSSGCREASLAMPLGPDIGQCCGGQVTLSVSVVDDRLRRDLRRQAEAEDAARPCVHVFGGGHVGHALAAALDLLPVRVLLVETRAEALHDMPQGVSTRLTAMPEEIVREAPPGSVFVVLTHDHSLDFLIVSEALKRADAAYVGMIGSRSKKAVFRNWYLREAGGTERDFGRLVCPIGGDAVRDKRPTVIAALAAAEIVAALAAVRLR